MATKDNTSRHEAAKALQAIVVNNDTEGKGVTVDLQGFESVVFAVSVGVTGDTLSGTDKLEFLLQHSDTTTDGDFAAVTTDGDVIGQTPNASTGKFLVIDDNAEDDVVFLVGYVGSKRYVRLVCDTSGTHTNGTPIAAVALKGHARHLP